MSVTLLWVLTVLFAVLTALCAIFAYITDNPPDEEFYQGLQDCTLVAMGSWVAFFAAFLTGWGHLNGATHFGLLGEVLLVVLLVIGGIGNAGLAAILFWLRC